MATQDPSKKDVEALAGTVESFGPAQNDTPDVQGEKTPKTTIQTMRDIGAKGAKFFKGCKCSPLFSVEPALLMHDLAPDKGGAERKGSVSQQKKAEDPNAYTFAIYLPELEIIKIDIVAIGNSNIDDWCQESHDDARNPQDESSHKGKKNGDPAKDQDNPGGTGGPTSSPSNNWLAARRMLPASMPQARIMEFHYPPKGDDPKLIGTTATNFLECLSKHRDAPGRPVIFIAHGNGGLILEKTLVLDNTAPSPQLLRLRDDIATPSQDKNNNAPEERSTLPATKKLQLYRADWYNPPVPNEKPTEDDSDPIHPPKDLHDPSLIAGIIFLETTIGNPDGIDHFQRDFVSVVVEWDIPVQWYRSKEQTRRERFEFRKSIFKEQQDDQDTPATIELSTFSQEGNEGSLNKFSDPGDENYSSVLRKIRSMFKNDQFLQAVYRGDVTELANAIKLKRIDPNEPKRYGNSALHIVSERGPVAAVETLLDNNADITAKTENRDEKTALRIAVENVHPEIVKLLLKKGAPIDPPDNETSSILDLSKEKSQDAGLSGSAKEASDEIYELLKETHIIEGPSGPYNLPSDPEFSPIPRKGSSAPAPISSKWMRCKLDDPQLPQNQYAREACNTYRITVADFFVQSQLDKNGDPTQCREYRSIKSYSVHDVLYNKTLKELPNKEARKQGLDKIQSQFTWYHVPANNIAWVQGLFIKLDKQEWFHQGAQETRGGTSHSRFMTPKMSKFNPDGDRNLKISLFTPFLNIEPSKRQRENAKAIKTAKEIRRHLEAIRNIDDSDESDDSQGPANSDELPRKVSSDDDPLLIGYLDYDQGLHIRRTLAQSYYPMLSDTTKRDKSQVLYRHPESGSPRCVVMVDQLWLWMVDDVLVTSFPLKWGKHDDEDHDILDLLLRYLTRRDRLPLLSICDLASLIVQRCAGLIGSEHRHLPAEYNVVGMIAKTIGKVSNDETNFLEKFKDSIKQLSKVREHEKKKSSFSYLDNKLETDDEAEASEDDLESPVSDSEASDIGSISTTSESWKTIRAVRRLEARQDRKKWEANVVNTFSNIAAETTQLIAIKDVKAEVDMLLFIMEEQLKWISSFVRSIPDSAQTRELGKMVRGGRNQVLKLKSMWTQSDDIYKSMDHLLLLKQQQANASEARIANLEAIETSRQGKTLMVFTVVTIIFLPASFMAAFITIPIASYPHDSSGASSMTLHWASKYIFPISFAISIPFLIIAFSMPKIEEGIKKRTRKAKAVTLGSSPRSDLRGFDKVKEILFWLVAGFYRWLSHYLWSVEVFWLLERFDDCCDLAASLWLLVFLRSRQERRWRWFNRMFERNRKRERREEKYGIR